MKTSNIIHISLIISTLAWSCGKKSDSDSSASNVTASTDDPISLMDISLGSLDSAAGEMSAGLSKTGVYLADNDLVFTSEDCTDRAEPQARDSDGVSNMDEQGRLLPGHPRYALQDFYCKIHSDAGNFDSFIGAVSHSRLLFCLIGTIRYDGVERAFAVPHDQLKTCLGVEPPVGGTVSGKVTASLKPTFGAPGAWSAGLQIQVPDLQIDAKLLLKLDSNTLAIASLGSALREDGYLLAIDRAKGELRFEGKFQRYDIQENSDAAGWTRHIRAYLKASLDGDFKVSSVNHFAAIYSDVSRMKLDGSPSDLVQQGSYWTVNGTRTGGVLTHAGRLRCFYDSASNQNVCSDPNRGTSWVDDYPSACDGQTEDNNCETEGIRLGGDADTQFFMLPNHAAFEKTSAWFAKLAVPTYMLPSFRISE